MSKLAYIQGYLSKKSVEVQDREPMYTRPVSSTIGRLGGLKTTLLGTSAPLKPGANKKDLVKIIEMVKDKTDDGMELRLNLGGGKPIDDLTRTWKNPRTSALTKILSTLRWPTTAATTALTRADHYNPASHAVTLYNNDPDILAHELGHAHDFSKRNNPGAYGFLRGIPAAGKFLALPQEFTASERGMRLLNSYYKKKYGNNKERLKDVLKNAQKKLGTASGSYVGSALGMPLTGLIGGRIVGKTLKPFPTDSKGPTAEKDWGRKNIK